MRTLSRIVLAFALTVAAASSFATTGEKANNVTVFNDSTNLIVQVTQATDAGEQNVKLYRHDNTLPSGASERVALNKAAGCQVIIKVTYEDGTQVTQPSFNACTTGSVNLTQS
jgi:hypothetical protein